MFIREHKAYLPYVLQLLKLKISLMVLNCIIRGKKSILNENLDGSEPEDLKADEVIFMRITYGCYRFLTGVNLMGLGGSQASFLSLNTLHVCWEQSGSASGQLEALPRSGDDLCQTELLSPPKPLHCDRETWKYLAALGTEKKK